MFVRVQCTTKRVSSKLPEEQKRQVKPSQLKSHPEAPVAKPHAPHRSLRVAVDKKQVIPPSPVEIGIPPQRLPAQDAKPRPCRACLLYTSDAADE